MALDPTFAHAWAQLSRAASLLYYNSTPTPALAGRSRQAAEKAVALAPDRPEGYLALGDHRSNVVNDPRRAVERLAEGQRRGRGNADILTASALAEQSLGRWESAVENLRQFERLSR